MSGAFLLFGVGSVIIALMAGLFQLEILERLLKPEANLPLDTAKYILDVHLEEKDHQRMEELGVKANRGILTKEEDQELQYYLLICDALNILHAKARLSLKTHNTAA
jgi:hypothetical protein